MNFLKKKNMNRGNAKNVPTVKSQSVFTNVFVTCMVMACLLIVKWLGFQMPFTPSTWLPRRYYSIYSPSHTGLTIDAAPNIWLESSMLKNDRVALQEALSATLDKTAEGIRAGARKFSDEQFCTVYLFAFLPVNYGHNIVQHFIDYYIQLGMPASNFLIVLIDAQANASNASNTSTASNASGLPDSDGLTKVRSILSSRDIKEVFVVSGSFDYTVLSDIRYNVIKTIVPPELTWVIQAQYNELIEFKPSLPKFILNADLTKSTIVYGASVDRLSHDCQLRQVNTQESLLEQFPRIFDPATPIDNGTSIDTPPLIANNTNITSNINDISGISNNDVPYTTPVHLLVAYRGYMASNSASTNVLHIAKLKKRNLIHYYKEYPVINLFRFHSELKQELQLQIVASERIDFGPTANLLLLNHLRRMNGVLCPLQEQYDAFYSAQRHNNVRVMTNNSKRQINNNADAQQRDIVIPMPSFCSACNSKTSKL